MTHKNRTKPFNLQDKSCQGSHRGPVCGPWGFSVGCSFVHQRRGGIRSVSFRWWGTEGSFCLVQRTPTTGFDPETPGDCAVLGTGSYPVTGRPFDKRHGFDEIMGHDDVE